MRETHIMSKKESTSLLGPAVLLSWANIPEQFEDDYNNYYTFEHIAERITIPGFLRARRWVGNPQASSAAPSGAYGKYLTLYETADKGVLTSDAYFHHLNNPTPWSV